MSRAPWVPLSEGDHCDHGTDDRLWRPPRAPPAAMITAPTATATRIAVAVRNREACGEASERRQPRRDASEDLDPLRPAPTAGSSVDFAMFGRSLIPGATWSDPSRRARAA